MRQVMKAAMLLSRTLWGASLLLLSPVTHASPPKPVAGLNVIGASLDLDTQEEMIQVQNVSNKTAVAYMLRFVEFDAQGNEIGDANFRQGGWDWAEPNADPNNTSNFILPGRIVSLPGKASPDAVSIAATVTAVVWEDGTHEGLSQGFFLTRAKRAREARDAAAKETSAQKKAEWTKRAEWYEAHGPKEATK